MRVYLSSQDSLQLYPDNTSSNFRVQLPQYMIGFCECAVIHCALPGRPGKPVYVLCDFVESSILGNTFQPVLCVMTSKIREFSHLHYTNVKNDQLLTLHIKLVNRAGVEIVQPSGSTVVVLDFLKECRLSKIG